MKSLLEKLQIKEGNPGVCTGPESWIDDKNGRLLDVTNPTTGETIAKVRLATASSYEIVIKEAQRAFKSWRSVPAPKRGQVIRDLGNAVHEYKEPLGELISWRWER